MDTINIIQSIAEKYNAQAVGILEVVQEVILEMIQIMIFL